jgi:hypothetical protein
MAARSCESQQGLLLLVVVDKVKWVGNDRWMVDSAGIVDSKNKHWVDSNMDDADVVVDDRKNRLSASAVHHS